MNPNGLDKEPHAGRGKGERPSTKEKLALQEEILHSSNSLTRGQINMHICWLLFL